MNTAENMDIINKGLGAKVAKAIIGYIDDFKEDKISLLRLEMKSLFIEQDKKFNSLENKMDVRFIGMDKKIDVGFSNIRTEIAESRNQTNIEIRNQTRWFISSVFVMAGLTIAIIKIL